MKSGRHSSTHSGRTLLALIASSAFALLALVWAPDANAAERDRYIVVFEDSVEHPANFARAQVEQRDGKLGFVYRYALNGYSAELPVQAVTGLRRDPRVKYVALDGVARPAAQTTPTGISRTFATANKALDIDSVDDVRIAANIAVIDTGVDYTHPDLNVVARTDCSNGAEKEAKCVDSSGTDTAGHGTHVAGIAGAIDNGSGVVGTAPGVQIWAVKVLGSGFNYTSEIVAGIEWVTAKRKDEDPHNNIDVINMSLECPGCEAKPYDEAITSAVEAGVVVVVAAGNKETPMRKIPPPRTAPMRSPCRLLRTPTASLEAKDRAPAQTTIRETTQPVPLPTTPRRASATMARPSISPLQASASSRPILAVPTRKPAAPRWPLRT